MKSEAEICEFNNIFLEKFDFEELKEEKKDFKISKECCTDVETDTNSSLKVKSKSKITPYSHLSNERRKEVIHAIQTGLCTRISASKKFNIPYPTITRVYNNYLKTGKVYKQYKNFGKDQIQFLLDSLLEDCTYSVTRLMDMVNDKFQIQVSKDTIYKSIPDFHFSLKKESTKHIASLTTKDIYECKEYCNFYLELQRCGRPLLYFHESNFQITIRLALKDNDEVIMQKKRILVTLTNNELIYYKAAELSGNKKYFLKHMKKLIHLLKKVNLKEVVLILNKKPSYNEDEVRSMFQDAGHDILFITPYKLSFNPAQIMLSHWTSFIESERPNDKDRLETLVTSFSGLISAQHCNSYCQQVLKNMKSCISETRT